MTDDLRKQYLGLFAGCKPNPDTLKQVGGFINRMFAGITRYETVQAALQRPDQQPIPWYVIAAIHGLESDFDFTTHLHNGDPLRARTVHVPKGRPPLPLEPPFTWEVSAEDALRYDKFTAWDDWTVPGVCYKLESYNGFGYRRHGINSPYLWSMSNQYERGKFTADGEYDPDAVSSQVGAMTALKQMVDDNLIAFMAEPVSPDATAS